jgi:hypothetical protein
MRKPALIKSGAKGSKVSEICWFSKIRGGGLCKKRCRRGRPLA